LEIHIHLNGDAHGVHTAIASPPAAIDDATEANVLVPHRPRA
jgi:hypothetical protein